MAGANDDGALLRDQLRQSAQLWHDRGGPKTLWSGTALRESSCARANAGGLTAAEEDSTGRPSIGAAATQTRFNPPRPQPSSVDRRRLTMACCTSRRWEARRARRAKFGFRRTAIDKNNALALATP